MKNMLCNEFNWRDCLLLILAGAATTLAFAPFFQPWVLCLCLPILVLNLRNIGANAKRKHHFIYGWCYGVGYFLASTYWIANALLVDSARYFWYIPIATLGLSSVLACYFGLMAMLLRGRCAAPIVPYSFAFAATWLGCELLRSYAFTGFPWNLLGYAWGASEISIQAASIGGVFSLSLFAALFAMFPLWLYEKRFAAVAVVWACMIGLLGFGTIRLQNNPTIYVPDVQLRVVQAAIPQSLKWEAGHKIAAFREHLRLSALPAKIPPTHIIWSESSMTTPFVEGDYVAKLLSEAAPNDGSLITGVVRTDGKNIYNSTQAITATGKIDAIYDKRHLVPFGEYMPFREWIPFKKLTSGTIDFASGSNQGLQQTPLLQQTRGAPPLHTIICYEAIFPDLSKNNGAKWLLNLTNDAWFGNSTGPRQHLQMARMRAVEQGLPLVRAAGSGISAVIDAYGRVLQTLEIGEKGVLDSALPQHAPNPPFAAKYGVYLSLIFMLSFWLISNILAVMKAIKRHFVHLIMLTNLAACGGNTVREELGLVRTPPDEFKVVSRAPLTVPKEFFLYPPEEAAARAENSGNNNTAKTAIFGNDAPSDDYLQHYKETGANALDAPVENVGSSELPSNGETGFLQKIGGNNKEIRAILREENDANAAKQDDLLEQLKQPIISGEPIIDADKERTRLKQNKANGKPINNGKVPTVTEKKTLIDRFL